MAARGKDVGYYALRVIPSFEGGVGKINRDLNKAFDGVSKSASDAISSGVRDGVTDAERVVKASSTKIVALRDKEADAAGKLRVAEERLNEVRASGKGGSTLARAEEARERALRGQAAALRTVETETKALERAQEKLNQAQREVAKAPADAGGWLDRLKGKANSAADAVSRIGMSAQSGDTGGGAGGAGLAGAMLLGRAGVGGLASLSGAAGTAAGTAMKAGIAGALVGAAATSVPAFAAKAFAWGAEVGLPLERQMNTLRGVTNATGLEMSAAGAEVRRLGSDTTLAGVTATTAAAAMTELAKGGLDVREAMAATRGTMQLATAGQLAAAEAAKYQTAAMNMFQLKADQAGHVADLFAAAANASSADVSDLGMALQQGGSVAGGFGMSLEETMSVLTAFSRLGINASDAGTMLKTSLQAITDKNKPAQGAIDELGLHLYNAQGKFVGYTNMMTQVAEASKHMTEEQFQAATAVLFGSDAMRASMIAAKGGPELFQGTADAMNNVDGAAARMAEAQMHGLPGVLEGIGNTVDAVKLSVYDAGNGIATALGQEALGGLDGLANWVTAHQPQIVGFFTFMGTQAVALIGDMARAVEYGTDLLAGLVNVIGDTVGGVTRAQAAVQRVMGNTDRANELDHQADLAFGWSDGLEAVVTKAHDLGGRMDDLQGKIQRAGDQANNAAKLTVALGDSIASVPDGKDIVITNNTPKNIEDLRKLGIEVQQTPTGLKIVATTDEAKAIVDAWRRQQGIDPVKVPVEPTIDPAAQERFNANMRLMLSRAGRPDPTMPPGAAPPPPAPPTQPPRAHGGVFMPAAYAFGKMPSEAIIQPATAGLVQWAEPSTRGEAFIPLGGGQRSRDIWAETGRQLGVMRFDVGGFRGLDALNNTVQSLSGHKYSTATGDDCSGTQSQLVNAMLGLAPKTDRMSTATAASWLTGKGAVLGVGPPGTFRIGWKNGGPGGGHMAGTLPDGTNVEQGGSNNGFTIGGGAAGAMDKQFTDHAYFPLNALFPDGMPSGGVVSPFNGAVVGGSGAGGGGASGGASGGTYTAATAKQLRDADQKVTDADNRVREVEARKREAEADGKMKDSERIRLDNELAKARREAQDARTDREEVGRGKFTPGKGGSGKSGGDDLSPLGGIFGSFLKETTGLDGSFLPDPSELGIVKFADALMNVKFGGPDDGQTGGYVAGLPNQQGTGLGFDTGSAASGLPFGMIPAAIDAAGRAVPGMAPPGSPASGNGLGAPPGPIDASRNVSISVDSGPNAAQIGDTVRREVANVDRLHTYVPRGG